MDTIEVKSTEKNTNIELHYNLWDSEKNKIKCLDIGIMANTKDAPYEIHFRIPGKYKSKNIEDLGKILIEKNNICNNIFNCTVVVTARENSLFATAEKEENKEKFIIQPFTIQNDENIDKNENNILIKLRIKEEENFPEYRKKYFRIRIKKFDDIPFILKSTSRSKLFESSFEKNKILDFRMNDIKLLSPEISKQIKDSGLKIKKVHFLYITDFEKNIVFSNPEMKIRAFERESWKDYIETKTNEMIAYHMTFKDDSQHTPIFLLKMQENVSSILHIIVYALGVIGLAVLANRISSCLGF